PCSSPRSTESEATNVSPQASSPPPQIVVSVSDHRTIFVVLFCRQCHARIQASLSCSSSPSLSRYRIDRATMSNSYVLQHKLSNLWVFSSWP
ncbi:unnamed protein product, partial [Brassica oleracea]